MLAEQRVDATALEHFVEQAFLALGMSAEQAAICADALMQSELRCHPGQGQGVRRLLAYAQRLEQKSLRLDAPFTIDKESPALALVNANNGLGSVIGHKAMQLAVRKAKDCGVGMVLVHNSSHFGSAAVHARIAEQAGCVGLVMTNAGAEMAAWGGASPVVGTNPWAIAAPTGKGFATVLDIALTTAGKGMMRYLAERQATMPLDWALTPEGQETDDPQAAMAGALLGIGQYKGYGLSFMTDVLTGVLGGGGFGQAPYSDPQRQDVSHSFLALDIAWFMPLETFTARMDAFIDEIKASKLRPGVQEVFVPGEIEARREQERRSQGVALPLEHIEAFRALAAKYGLESSALDAVT